jgi:TRAP transporter 4TM/12TM fusion protein
VADPPPDDLSDEEAEEIIEGIERKRHLTGRAAAAVSVIGVAFSLFQVWLAARGFVFEITLPVVGTVRLAALQLLQVNAIHVAFALVLAFLVFPPTTGDGRVATRLSRAVPALERRVGEDHPLARAARALRRAVRWAAVDPDRTRVTPLDLVFAALAALTAVYMVNDFAEIQRLRVFGLEAGRSVGEILAAPLLALADLLGPLGAVAEAAAAAVTGLPFAGVSYAFALGVVGVLLVLEATRRSLGLYLALLVASFVVYARYGYLIQLSWPVVGVLSIPEGSWPNIVQNLWYNTENGVFGIPVTVSVQFIYIFILFGAFLEASGAGRWFIDLAYSATGTRKGGPAKASILASGFMGTISGSSIANTVTTGAFTIPLMKRSGYRPSFAGAVEASASSGGQILPPVMGAAAFLMIEFIGVPFVDIITAAAIPAVVFFFGVWVMVHLEASREGIGGLSREEITPVRSHLRRGWFYLVPVALLLYYLVVERLTVSRSAWFTLVAIMALLALVAAYSPQTRVPLTATVVGLALVQFASFLVAGAPLLSALLGGGGEGLAPAAAASATLGSLGAVVVGAGVATMLAFPRADAPLLDLDESVDHATERLTDLAGRPSLADVNLVRYGTFVGKSLDDGARSSVEVVVAVAAAGVIPGVVSATGLGPNLTALIKAVAGGSIVLLLLFTAVASVILGMGMPTTVTYIILVSLLGPAIAQSSDVPLLAAHLFILYFGVIADITPPVAVAAYAASGISKSDPFRTGVEAFSLSLNKAIVPFAFALTPGILLIRGRGESAQVIGFADVADLAFFVPDVVVPVAGVFLGVVALGATVIGFLYGPVSRVERLAFALAALLLMAPGLVVAGASDLFGTPVALPLADLALRAAGGLAFGALALLNRAELGSGAAEPAD